MFPWLLAFISFTQTLSIELEHQRTSSGCGLVTGNDGTQYAMVVGGSGEGTSFSTSEILDLQTMELHTGKNIHVRELHCCCIRSFPQALTCPNPLATWEAFNMAAPLPSWEDTLKGTKTPSTCTTRLRSSLTCSKRGWAEGRNGSPRSLSVRTYFLNV